MKRAKPITLTVVFMLTMALLSSCANPSPEITGPTLAEEVQRGESETLIELDTPEEAIVPRYGVSISSKTGREWNSGIFDEIPEFEIVEILAYSGKNVKIRWVSLDGTEIVGWTWPDNIETPTPIPPTPDMAGIDLPSYEEAIANPGIKASGGDSLEEVIAAYGQPSINELLDNFNPQIMRQLWYYDLGLKFLFNREVLCCINVYDDLAGNTIAYGGTVFGLKIGDHIMLAISIFGEDYGMTLSSTYNKPDLITYLWPEKLPNWLFLTEGDKIIEFRYFDREIYGKWTVDLP